MVSECVSQGRHFLATTKVFGGVHPAPAALNCPRRVIYGSASCAYAGPGAVMPVVDYLMPPANAALVVLPCPVLSIRRCTAEELRH
jgi:hypothetical protein